jgi:hypothetical protein
MAKVVHNEAAAALRSRINQLGAGIVMQDEAARLLGFLDDPNIADDTIAAIAKRVHELDPSAGPWSGGTP